MSIVLDYSNWRPPSPRTLVDHGVVGVVAYIKPARFGWPKAIKQAEDAGLEAAGIARAYNYENNPGDWQGGYAAGFRNGTEAAQSMVELGRDVTVPVYVSYDQEIQPAQFALAREYHRGFRDGCGHPLGVYGEGTLIEDLGTQWGWESESTSFPGNAAPTPHTVLVQHYGQQIPGLPGAYDVNTALKADWGQYPRPTPTPPAPKPPVWKVQPMHKPPIPLKPCVADLRCPTGGAWTLHADGGVAAWGGAPFHGAPHGQPLSPGEEWADLVLPRKPGEGPNYVALTTAGDTYNY